VVSRADMLQHPDLEWRKRLDDIQRAHAQTLEERSRPRDAFRVARRAGHTVGSVKAASLIPEVHTSHAQEVRAGTPYTIPVVTQTLTRFRTLSHSRR
jgi:hypothetical protein